MVEMASVTPKIVTFRFVSTEDASKIVIEFGVKTIEKPIPAGQGVLRCSAILNDKIELIDAELVTEKI
jgi:hypothetical protein